MTSLHASSLVDLIQQRAELHPDRLAIRFLADGATVGETVTYGQLHAQCLAVAAQLRERAPRGARALLLYPNGIDYAVSYFASLYAGLVAVPAYVPESSRAQHVARVLSIASDATPALALAESGSLATLRERLPSIPLLSVDRAQRAPFAPDPIELAMLQYTSGSTASPKGVMVSHANLLANSLQLSRGFGTSEETAMVSWLPLFHDMGLIGKLIQSVFVGSTLTLMTPQHFVMRPLRWLKAVMDAGMPVVSGAPNFAFKMCADRVRESELAELDLSRWQTAFCGAEPIRPDTFEVFERTFAPAGFRTKAFYPCYGLAEATLYVSGGLPGRGPTMPRFSAASLRGGRAELSDDGERIVCCGEVADEHQLLVVRDGVERADGEVGELWISGPSVCAGYWQNEAATRETMVEHAGRRYLRTGDLGFVCDRGVYIVSRAKDLIIVRGANLYPPDIERVIEAEVALVRRGRVAVFAVQTDAGEGIGVALELEEKVRALADPARVCAAIRECVTREFGSSASLVLLLRQGTMPITSSGKLRRRACRDGFLDGTLVPFAFEGDVLHAPETSQLLSATEARLAEIWQGVLGKVVLARDSSLFGLGAGSVDAAEIAARISEAWNLEFELRHALEARELGAMASEVERRAGTMVRPIPVLDRDGVLPVSPHERRLWTVWRVAPESTAYNVTARVCLEGPVHARALEQALALLIERHEVLRTAYVEQSGMPRRQIQAPFAVPVACATGRPDVRALATQPFDLAKGPLLRAQLFELAGERFELVICMHHIVCDGWSMDVLLDELLRAYEAVATGCAWQPAPLATQMADYAAFDEGADEERVLNYWRVALGNQHPLVELPLDRPRPRERSHAAGQHEFTLTPALTLGVRTLASAHQVSPFMVLLAALQALLRRYGNASEVRIGVPMAQRAHPGVQRVLGFCVNTLLIRSEIDGGASFEHLLERARTQLLEVQQHGRLPYDRVVDALKPERSLSHNPLFQVMFNHVETRYRQLAPAAGVRIGQLARPTFETELDLALDTSDEGTQLVAALSYSLDLFDACTAKRIARHYVRLLEEVTKDPRVRLDQLAIFEHEEQSVLRGARTDVWVSTLHELFAVSALRTPDALAVCAGDQQLSYRELDERSNRVAHALRARGVRRDDLVAVDAERDLDLVVGLLGILKAGAGYVPIDPELPEGRKRALRESVCFELDAAFTRGEEVARACSTPLVLAHHAQQRAYCLYTSGSTGQPKGVSVAHQSVVNHTRWLASLLGGQAPRRVLQSSALGFDASVCELWLPLLHGGSCVIARERQPAELLHEVSRHGVTMMQGVPSYLRMLLDSEAGRRVLAAVPHVISGGEALDAGLAEQLQQVCRGRVYNMYGPTEVTVDATAHELLPGSRVGLGTPIHNASAYLLSDGLRPVARGCVGELFVGGAGVARGYLAAALTAERFLPDPFSPGGRMYRTGDLARLRADGSLEFVGRLDQQVKLNGQRIELGEVEAALAKLPEVREVVVRTLGDVPRLVAYVVPRVFVPDATQGTLRDALVEALMLELPRAMVPLNFLFLPSLPRLESGKVDASRLPIPAQQLRAHRYQAPRTDAERALGAIMERVLRVSQVGRDDNFFAMGGDSIHAIQLVSRAREQGLELTAKDVFRHQSLARIAEHARALKQGPVASELPFALVTLRDEDFQTAPVPREQLEDAFPLSPMQQGMVLHTLLEPGSGMYLMQDVYRIDSALDPQRFVGAFRRVLARHPALRVSFWQRDQELLQIVHRDIGHAVSYLDWRALSPEEQERELDRLLAEERAHGFDMWKGPLLALRLVQLSDESFCYVESHHHVLMDDWCRSLLLVDFFAEYERRPLVRSAPAYRDFIAWLQTRNRDEARQFWSTELAGFCAPNELAGMRAVGGQSSRVCDLALDFDESETQALASFVRASQLTLNTLVQGAWAVVVSQYSGQDDVVFGVTVAGRPSELPGIHDTIGLFVNTIPLRVRVQQAEFLSTLQAHNASIRVHEHVPLAEIQGLSELGAGKTLFHSLFVFENAPLDPALLAAMRKYRIELRGNRTHTNYPLTAVAVPGARLKLVLSYDERAFVHEDAERMLVSFKRAVQALADGVAPGAIPAQSELERSALAAWNQTTRAIPAEHGYAALFEAEVRRGPDRRAVRAFDGELSYAALDRRASGIACRLRERGLGIGDVVAVCSARGVAQLQAMVGILKAGAAYMPLDPSLPPARAQQLAQRAGVKLVLCAHEGSAFAQALGVPTLTIDEREADLRGVTVPPDAPAYVLFTSGSTGAPKGVVVTSAGMLNNQLSKVPLLALSERDVIAQTASQSFDISVWQFLAALLFGGSVEVIEDEVARDPARLLERVAERGVTVLESVPALMRGFFFEGPPRALPALRWIMPTGEALTCELVDIWFARYPQIPIVNAYGPAECADDVALDVLREPGVVTIGRANDNTQLYVLNAALQPAPVGVVGELCVGGVGVGLGYVADPGRTAELFVPNPFATPGARMYRTGDLARYRADGRLEYIGRADQQVKIRGHRIELGEIEARLNERREVQEAAVLAREDDGERRLVAYIAPRDRGRGAEAREQALRVELERVLSERLPTYMLPDAYVFLRELPRLPSGKLNRQALPAPERQRASEHLAPRDEVESKLVAIWSDVLGVSRVGLRDDFFQLGGHSLLLTRVSARIRGEFGVEVALRELFEATTAERHAGAIKQRLRSRDDLSTMLNLLDDLEQTL
jgi:amino acid adenylation domain-containing protein